LLIETKVKCGAFVSEVGDIQEIVKLVCLILKDR